MADAQSIERMVAPLFVPATMTDRFMNPVRAGADGIILDLEDAVAPQDKDRAREALTHAALPSIPRILRVNSANSAWHREDLACAAQLRIDAVMLPKCETLQDIVRVRDVIGVGKHIIALLETAAGIANARAIASSEGVVRLAFGAIDFAVDVGCAEEWNALLYARSEIVLASRLAGLTAPLDGVTLALRDEDKVLGDARLAAQMGFGGKLCIHPAQVRPTREGFLPTQAEIDWAKSVLGVDAAAGVGAALGEMVDAPVRRRAHRILVLMDDQ